MLSLAELGRRKEHKFTETSPGADNLKLNWWKVHSANMLGNEISGWVREQNFAGGRVTREYPQDWVDFQTIEGAHDHAHTLCAKSKAYVDYACDKDMPATAALDKLSPLMKSVYQAICPGSNGERAIDELCVAAKDRWQSLRASRLIIRHESEWANASKWKSLTAELEKETGANAQYAAEQRRIEKLVWWEEVKARLPDLPGPAVFHMHPVGVVGNYFSVGQLRCTNCATDLFPAEDKLREIFKDISDGDADAFADSLFNVFTVYGINTCHRVSHFLAQCEVECSGFTAFSENLYYSNGDYLWSTYPSALKAGLGRLYPRMSLSEMEQYTKQHLVKNDRKLGEVLFGDGQHPGKDYRGRGLLHMTWLPTYEEYKVHSGIDVVNDPNLVTIDPFVAADSAAWFWYSRSINKKADDNDIRGVTFKISPALKEFARRKSAAKRVFEMLNKGGGQCGDRWRGSLTERKGW